MPYSKARYSHNRQLQPNIFDPKTFKTVSLSHTKYKGNKFKGIKGALAVIGREKSTRKIKIQLILIPK
jgi:hypothetical protein